MRYLIYIVISLFVVCGCTSESYGQFWKKKSSTASATRKSGGSAGGKKRDAFAGKSKKGPNIYSSKPPRTKSKSKLYAHSVSKKRLKKGHGSTFSSKKRRYKMVNSKPKGKGDSGAKSSSGGRKSGKGRKKD
jgi:hypothetical protein